MCASRGHLENLGRCGDFRRSVNGCRVSLKEMDRGIKENGTEDLAENEETGFDFASYRCVNAPLRQCFHVDSSFLL